MTRRSSSSAWPRSTPGYCTYTDYEIGRFIDYLESTGELDNTLLFVISDNGASGEGGPNGSVNENNFFNSVPDDMADNLCPDRQARLGRNLQPLSNRLGDGVQYALQAVQALDLGRRRLRSADRALAQGDQSQGRAARSVHPLHRYRADGLRDSGHGAAGRGQGLHPVAAGRHQLQIQLRRWQGQDRETEPVLCDARHARALAGWLEGRCPACGRAVGLESFRRWTSGRSTTSTTTDPRCTTWAMPTPICAPS